MKKIFWFAVFILLLAVKLYGDSTAAVIDPNGQAMCEVTVFNSHNPSQYPDGVYDFSLDWMFTQHLYCTDPPDPSWTYIGTWMGV